MANFTDIKRKARKLVDATTTSYPDSDLFYELNQALEEINGKLISLNKNIRYDDANYANVPYGDGTLEEGIQAYASDLTMLSYERIEVKDKNGIWHKLSPIDESKIQGSLAEYKKTPGLPEEYAERGNSIFLYPAPSATETTLIDGIRFYFQRGAYVLTCTTWSGSNCTAGTYFEGTLTPGFPVAAHYLPAYKAALPYAQSYKKDRVAMIENEIARLENILYGVVLNKQEDKLSRLVPKVEDNR
jgi:hypothetical protein